MSSVRDRARSFEAGGAPAPPPAFLRNLAGKKKKKEKGDEKDGGASTSPGARVRSHSTSARPSKPAPAPTSKPAKPAPPSSKPSGKKKAKPAKPAKPAPPSSKPAKPAPPSSKPGKPAKPAKPSKPAPPTRPPANAKARPARPAPPRPLVRRSSNLVMDTRPPEERFKDACTRLRRMRLWRVTAEEWMRSKQTKKLRHRNDVFREIISTELRYVESLGIIVTHYLHPMQEMAESRSGVCSTRDVWEVFSNIETLYLVHLDFLQKLEIVHTHWPSDTKLGPLFKEHCHLFRLYIRYVNNFERASAVLDRLSKNKSFAAFLQSRHELPQCEGLSLQSYLIMPVQRLPRYQLLLQDLIKHTPEEHIDLPDLREALQLVLKLADFVNEGKRECEVEEEMRAKHMEHVKEMFPQDNKWADDPGRWYICEGKLERLKKGKHERTEVFLFSDMVLTAVENRGITYKITDHINLEHCSLRNLTDEEALPFANVFELKLHQLVGSKTYTMQAASADKKERWVERISGAISDLERTAANWRRRALRTDVSYWNEVCADEDLTLAKLKKCELELAAGVVVLGRKPPPPPRSQMRSVSPQPPPPPRSPRAVSPRAAPPPPPPGKAPKKPRPEKPARLDTLKKEQLTAMVRRNNERPRTHSDGYKPPPPKSPRMPRTPEEKLARALELLGDMKVQIQVQMKRKFGAPVAISHVLDLNDVLAEVQSNQVDPRIHRTETKGELSLEVHVSQVKKL